MLFLAVRVGAIGIALALWFWTQKLISQKLTSTGGIFDFFHQLTAPLNTWFAANKRAADALLIITSLLIDVFGLYLFGASIFGPTMRPFIAFIALFTLRQFCQGTCSLPIPPGVIWRHPGFPSLLVTYDVSNDFFFSGHTAIAMLGAMELAHSAPLWLVIVAAVIAVGEAIAVIILRAHYMIDVFTAVFCAICCEIFAGHVAPMVDAWLH